MILPKKIDFPAKHLIILLLGLIIPATMLAEKPRIAVVEFSVKVPKARREVGTSMADLLIHALVQTERYSVLERSVLDKIRQEQGLALSGEVDAATGAQIGKLIGAKYLVVGAVTRFEEKTSGGGVGGLISKKLAGGAGYYNSHVGVTIRIIDSSTGEIITSENIDKKARALGLAAGTSILGFPMAGGLFKSASMQKAVQNAIEDAVKHIGKNIPSDDGEDDALAKMSLIQINAQGVDFRSLKSFMKLVQSIDGVENVTKTLDGNTGTVKAYYSGSADELADKLDAAASTEMNFEITGLSDNLIEIRMSQ